MMLDTRQVGLLLGCSPKIVRKRAQRLGVGQRDTSRQAHPWMFTRADVERLMNAQPRCQPRCPRCTILTPNGELCTECEWELEHGGRYQYVDELTGEER
jgi:hypothetical protein